MNQRQDDDFQDDSAILEQADIGAKASGFSDRIVPKGISISLFLMNLEQRKYQIPTFQRDVVWLPENVKKLWDSLFKFYPLGSLLVWRTGVALHSHRQIGGLLISPHEKQTEHQYLLDGQQRTTALYTSIFGGTIAGRENFKPDLYVDLSVELDGDTDDNSYRKRFLFEQEVRYSEQLKEKRRCLTVVSLKTILQRYEAVEAKLEDSGRKYSHPERVNLRRFRAIFDSYQLSLIELNGIQVAEVCQIFERVNTGGRPLSIFDIVVAKTYRPRDNAEKKPAFYLRELFDNFRADPRMAPSEYRHLSDHDYLQMLAVIVKLYVPESGISNITDRYLSDLRPEHIEEVWDDAAEAFRDTFRFLDRTLNLHGPGLVPYRYFYMVLVGYFFRRKNPDYALLKRYFWTTALDQGDLLTSTSSIWPDIQLLTLGGEKLWTDMVVDRAAFRSSRYNSKSRMYRAILGFFASQRPCNWDAPHDEVLASLYYQVTDRPNLHHIFPRAFVETVQGKMELEGAEMVDSLMNIAYITQLTNLQISARNPVDYLKDFASQPKFPDVLEGHLISRTILELAGRETMPIDALKTFIEDRIDQLVNRLKSLGLKVTESDSHTPPGRIVETQAEEG